MNITNKSILISGANRGIGKALVEEALRRGARKVYAGMRSPAQPPDTHVIPLALDVTSASQIKRAFDNVDALDVLINNAGIAIYDDLSDLQVIEQHLAMNFLGLPKVTQAFLPLLKRSKGAIVNNLSMVGLAPLPVIPSYSISKAAAFSMTLSLRALLAAQGLVPQRCIHFRSPLRLCRGLPSPVLHGLQRLASDESKPLLAGSNLPRAPDNFCASVFGRGYNVGRTTSASLLTRIAGKDPSEVNKEVCLSG